MIIFSGNYSDKGAVQIQNDRQIRINGYTDVRMTDRRTDLMVGSLCQTSGNNAARLIFGQCLKTGRVLFT